MRMVALRLVGPLLLLALLATACSRPGAQVPVLRVPPGTAVGGVLPECPSVRPASGSYQAGPAGVLVPASPLGGRLCHYAGLNDGQAVGSLRGSATIAGSSLGALVTSLDAVRGSFPSGPVNCPNDDESSDLAIFSYANSQPVFVTVSLTGCTGATNGRDHVAFFGDGTTSGARVLSLLAAVPVPATSAPAPSH